MGFAFKALPPTSFEDITLNFEQIGYPSWEGDVSGRLGDLTVNTVLGGKAPVTSLSGADVQIAGGSSSVAFAGNNFSSGTTINHGLGRVPSRVHVTLQGGFGAVAAIAPYVSSITTTSFAVQAVSDVSLTATVDFYWDAIG